MSTIIKNPFERKQKGIAALHLNFLRQLTLAVLVALFLPIACTKEPPVEEPPEEPVVGIIMTTQASEVSVWVAITKPAGSDDFAIDWGDGITSNISYYDPDPNSLIYSYIFDHSYSGVSEHRITITGDNIEALDCSNSLTSLDVSQYPDLNVLMCSYNQLTTLDLSKNTALEYLYCHDNPLTTLDLSNCTSLGWLQAKDCALTTLDFSNCPELTNVYCDNNQLTNLIVNTVVHTLACGYNQLTASALNNLFISLPDRTVYEQLWGRINIKGNPGTNDCDFSIAAEKRWQHWAPGEPSYPRSKSKEMENPEELYLNFLKQKKYEK